METFDYYDDVQLKVGDCSLEAFAKETPSALALGVCQNIWSFIRQRRYVLKNHDRYFEREEYGEWKPKSKNKKYRLYIPASKISSPQHKKGNWLSTNNSGERVIGKFHTKRDAEKSLESERAKTKNKSFSIYSLEDLESAVIEEIKNKRKIK